MKIGFIGIGIMGEAMCSNIIKKNDDEVYVFDALPGKTAPLEALGARDCANAAEVAKKSGVIITMVPKSEHSLAVCAEILPELHSGKIYIDMSTIDPDVSVSIYEKVKKTGARFADAPVVKSRPAAEAGKLGIYVGCEEDLFPVIRPVLAFMGENIIRMGPNGMGLVMKICHNSLVSQIQNGVNETLLLARSYGISVDDYKTAISYGGGQNFYLDGQAAKIRDEDWSTAFSLANMDKDLGIAERMSAQKKLRLPGLDNAKAVYSRGMADGIGKEDFRATYKVVKNG